MLNTSFHLLNNKEICFLWKCISLVNMNIGMFCLNIEVLVESKIYWSFYPNKCDQMTMWGVITFLDWHCIYYDGTTSQNLTVLKWKCQKNEIWIMKFFMPNARSFFVLNSIEVLKWDIFYILEHSAFLGNLWL